MKSSTITERTDALKRPAKTEYQLAFPDISPLDEAVEALARCGVEERGAIYTKREVVEFILDLAGYTQDLPLYSMRLLEPSFGDGDFLIPALERLFASYDAAGRPGSAVFTLRTAIRAVELHQDTFDKTRSAVNQYLKINGLSAQERQVLLTAWFHRGDFLLSEHTGHFTHIVGNPPYVRQEHIPDVLMNEYRQRYRTIYDRADVYVPFIERSLELLAEDGRVGFICADRWMKNRYGAPLRELVANNFRLRTYVDMVDTDAFLTDVSSYPAIFVLSREPSGPTRVAYRPVIESKYLQVLSEALNGLSHSDDVCEVEALARGSEPWVLDGFKELALVRRLESTLPTLEEAGCKVGIGVATGADRIFVAPFESLDVEEDRKLPLVMTKDIKGGSVKWRGFGVLNPFGVDGKLVDLSQYPRLARYLEEHGSEIKKRHVSKKNPSGWFRTIDRIYPALVREPKLLVPDIKGDAHIVFEPGQLYPHHNLYFITSSDWDLRALQAVLLSGVARLFVSVYSTKMRGGYLRFQAQYLRRIRVPHWRDVPTDMRNRLRSAAELNDKKSCDALVAELYALSPEEREILIGNG